MRSVQRLLQVKRKKKERKEKGLDKGRQVDRREPLRAMLMGADKVGAFVVGGGVGVGGDKLALSRSHADADADVGQSEEKRAHNR